MNLNDERNYQMCQGALDAMNLSPANRKLADEYLDIGRPADQSLLYQAAHQDFSQLSEEDRKKCYEYVEHLKKRNRTEDLARYVRFCAQVGGSTARYPLFNPWMSSMSYHGKGIQEYLTAEQIIAIQAEMIVWSQNINTMNAMLPDLKKSCEEQPQAVRRAMELCYHQKVNAKTLLAGIYLHITRPSKPRKSILKGLIGGSDKGDSEDITSAVKFLEDCLISSAPNLFADSHRLMDREKETLKKFLATAKADAPIDGEIKLILHKGGSTEDYLIRLLAGVAFLAVEHSDRFLLLVRIAMHVNPEETLNSCKRMCQREWFDDHIELLEKPLPASPKLYGKWCVVNQVNQPLQRMAKSDPETIRKLIPSLSTVQYQFLLEQVAKANPSLYQELIGSFDEEFRNRVAAELTDRFKTGGTEARDYLLGRIELEQLYPLIENWQANQWDVSMDWNDYKNMAQMRDGKDVAMFRRALTLEAVGCKTGFITTNQVFPVSQGRTVYNYTVTLDEKQILAALDVLEQEKVPVGYQLKYMEAIYDRYYQDSMKAMFLKECVKALTGKVEAWADELMDNAQNGSALVRCLCIRVLDTSWIRYKDFILSCAPDSSKQVRETLADIYSSHREWEPELLVMLTSKKSQERELAILVLGKWGAVTYREQLEKALETEKSKKIKDQILSALGKEAGADGQGQPGGAGFQSSDQLAAELLKGGKKRKVEWVSEVMLTKVHKQDGTETTENYLYALLVAYADMSTPGVSQDAARLAAELDQKELAAFMGLLFGKWMETGAEAKKKWVLYAASIHGGDAIVPILHHQIQVWPEAARGAIAAEAVKALALNGTSTALLLVDQISRKFKNRQVKSAAGEALSYAAEQLGITRAELEDKIVPSLDFDENQERRFDFGPRSFRVRLTPALELEIFDESGKKLKNLPSPGKQDDEGKAKEASESFKLMKKQLKTVVTNQKLRLEQALSAERLWQADKWQELFVKNPIMHQFAIGLIWGVYEQNALAPSSQSQATDSQVSDSHATDSQVTDGLATDSQASDNQAPVPAREIVLKNTFRYMEDGSFNTVDEEEYELPEGAKIGLVHPVELDSETLAAWKEQLSDYEVTQPFDQLDRPVYRIAEEEKKEKELIRFGGMLLNGLSLSGKLLSQGWFRGPVEDAGIFCSYYRNDGANGVELEFSGSAVGYEGEEVTVYGIYFYPSGEAAQGNYRYHKDYDKKRCLLSEVSPRYFSEIVLMVTRATASSQEKLPYPECKN